MSQNGFHFNGLGGNGQSKLLWWLIGGIITPLIIAGFNTLTGDSKRLAALETMVNVVENRLTRTENKLERLLEKKP